MKTHLSRAFFAAVAVSAGLAAQAQPARAEAAALSVQPAKNVVLVHGAFADGSGWRGVYDRLTQRGYRVTIVQNPLTSLADDVAATQRALERQDGPTILVGHSWGGHRHHRGGGPPEGRRPGLCLGVFARRR